MLSIIVCSVNKQFLNNFKKSTAVTIGVPFELLVWDNKTENKGLCEVYNLMAAKAQYPYLCFCHEDVLFETVNWGHIVIDIFKSNINVGLVGIAGSKYKSNIVSGWFTGIKHFDFYNILHFTNGKNEVLRSPQHWPEQEQQVACIDGVFMVCKKEVWEQHFFNQTLLRGFHFYDIDFSIRVAAHYSVIVTNRIHLVHITKGGDYGDHWLKEAFIYHNAQKKNLPFSVLPVNAKQVNVIIAKQWLDRLKKEKISFNNKKMLLKLMPVNKLKVGYSVIKFLLYKPLHLATLHKLIKKH